MTPELIFRLSNSLALAGWILLVFFGRRRWVSGLITGVFIPATFAAVYIALLLYHFGGSEGSFNTLAGVAALFSDPWLLLAGWIHYLAFDLFVGSWQVRDAAANEISHWLIAPSLILTFLFGPAGLLLYLGMRATIRRRVFIAEG